MKKSLGPKNPKTVGGGYQLGAIKKFGFLLGNLAFTYQRGGSQDVMLFEVRNKLPWERGRE